MPYNREIAYHAPLPSGALPTREQLDALVRRANEERARAVIRTISRLFRSQR
jgi:hypothetical protein